MRRPDTLPPGARPHWPRPEPWYPPVPDLPDGPPPEELGPQPERRALRRTCARHGVTLRIVATAEDLPRWMAGAEGAWCGCEVGWVDEEALVAEGARLPERPRAPRGWRERPPLRHFTFGT